VLRDWGVDELVAAVETVANGPQKTPRRLRLGAGAREVARNDNTQGAKLGLSTFKIL